MKITKHPYYLFMEAETCENHPDGQQLSDLLLSKAMTSLIRAGDCT